MGYEWEQSLIGSVMANPSAMAEVEYINPSDFGFRPHANIWHEMLSLHQRNALDYRAVSNLVKDEIASPDGEITGESYIRYLIDKRGTAIAEYAKQVLRASTRRQLLSVGALIAAEANDAQIPIEEAVSHAEERVMRLRRFDDTRNGVPIGELLNLLGKRIIGLRSGEMSPAYTPKIVNLRTRIGFLEADDYVILAGRPGQGKSSVMRFEAFKSAMAGEPTAIINLENGDLEYPKYLIAMYLGIDSRKLRDPRGLNAEELENIHEAITQMSNLPLFIIPGGSPSAEEVVGKIRKLKREQDIKSVWIDYLQLIANGNSENRNQDVSKTSRLLRANARNLGIPHIAASQMSRNIEQGSERDAQLSDLRESGSLEQDASIVIFIKHLISMAQIFPENRGSEIAAYPIKLNVAKNRNGPTGYTELIKWMKPTNDFISLMEEDH